MPFSDDHRAMTDTVAAWGQGHNPDGRQGSGQGDDLPPDLFSKVLRGEISPHAAQQEWAERAPSQRAFNNEIRRKARGGFVADTAAVMSQAGSDGSAGAPAVRNAETGRFADLGQAARDAGHKSMPGAGIVPQPTPPATDHIRQAYLKKQRERGGG